MNNVLFRRGNQTFIDNNVPLNDGQIIFNETDEAIYVDTLINGSVVRKRYGGGNLSRSDIDMALSTTSKNPVANKVITELMLQKADVIDNLATAVAVTKNGVPVGCKTVQGLNTKINTTQAQVSNSGDAYSTSKAYVVGDLCIYNNVLYRCITACSAGSWAINQSCFSANTLVNVGNAQSELIGYLNGRFSNSYHLTSKDDLNDIIRNGMYFDAGLDIPSHASPEFNHVYLVLYIPDAGGRVVQLSYSFNANKWYWRRRYSSDDDWTKWTEL